MNLLLKDITLIEPDNPLNGQQVCIEISDGIITKIATEIVKQPSHKTIEGNDLHVSIGWMDIGVQIGEPGLEHRENMEHVAKAANAGGFSAIASLPNTLPVVDSKSGVQFVQQNTQHIPVQFYPIGAITKQAAGKEISEMMDMKKAGAIAFSDGTHPIQHAGLMLRALQYVKAFDGIVMNQPNDLSISKGGQMHEGYWSTLMGTKGLPAVAEEMMVRRDIDLLRYTQSRLHISNISTAGSVDIIRKAKTEGLNVTCSVPFMNLILDDSEVQGFDSNYKVMPPLRAENDRNALIAGLKDGTVDAITSNHMPWDQESKALEFNYAEFGAIGLETVFAACNTYLSDVFSIDELVLMFGYQSRDVFNIKVPSINEGEKANLTIFDTTKEWTFEKSDIHSKSNNTPFIGESFNGKVIGVINGEKASFMNTLLENRSI